MEFDNSWRAVFIPGSAAGYFRPPPADAMAPLSEFRATNAWWLAELSRLVYLNNRPDGAPTRDQILAGVGLEESRYFHRRSTHCSIVEPRGESTSPVAVLVFRGTDGPVDWGTNARTLLSDWSEGGRVHAGFKSALEDVWHEVDMALDELEMPIFYAGHSQGGGLAMLAASRRPPLAVYTYGAPRVGNDGFAETLKGVAAYRLVNRRDTVPRTPPRMLGLRYRHAGELRAISIGSPRKRSRFPPLPGPHGWLDPPGPLCDHAPINYVACLERLASGQD